MKKVIVLIGSLVFAVAACKKPVTEPNSGIYRGAFYQIYDNGDTQGQGVVFISLSEGGNTYELAGDTNTGCPYSCNGMYSIDDATYMTFYNEAIVDVGYQPYYLLDTTCEYTFDDQNFSLTFKVDTARYEYNMVRI